MNRKAVISIGIILLCSMAAIAVFFMRTNEPVDEPVEVLRRCLASSSQQLEVIRGAPVDVSGRLLLSLGRVPATGAHESNVSLLESVAGDANFSTDSLGRARNAVYAAAESFMLTPPGTEASKRLRRILVDASQHSLPRMRSTFLAACSDYNKLLSDPDLLAAVSKLSESKEATLNIESRAKEILQNARTPERTMIPPGG